MRETYWLEDFHETCQDILEDVFLLEAVSMYISNCDCFAPGKKADNFSPVFGRLCGYLSQHALDLRHLEERLGPDPQ